MLAAVDDVTRAIPPERFVRRQLRRALRTLGTLQETLAGEEQSQESLIAVISRVHEAILGIDPHGSFIAASRGAEALTGFSRAELRARSVFDSAFGVDLPFAGIWQKHTGGRNGNGTAALRDRSGRLLRVEVEVSTLQPDLIAVAIGSSPV
jgi:PAS domain S-box-containing protein